MSSPEMVERRSLLYVDDDRRAFKITGELRRYGFDLTCLDDPQEALEYVQDNELDLIAVDLKMPKMNGVDLAREIKKIKPTVPIVVFSGNLREDDWKEKVKESEIQFEGRFEKPFPVDDERVEDFCGRLHKVIDRAKQKAEAPELPIPPGTGDGPFSISFQEYLKMSDEKVQQVRLHAWELIKDWFNNQIEEQKWDWIVLCGNRVVRTSSEGGPVPAWEELSQYGEDTDRIPFLFVRPPIIEESGWKAHKRSLTGMNDYYPTISCRVEYPQGNLRSIEGDFDTGSDTTCISSKIVPIERNDQPQSSVHLGSKYTYALKHVGFSFIDELGKPASVRLPIHVIEDGPKNPFRIVNPKRVMLAGRDILNHVRMQIILDSFQKKTFIYL